MGDLRLEMWVDSMQVRAEALLVLIDLYEFEAKYEPDFKEALKKFRASVRDGDYDSEDWSPN